MYLDCRDYPDDYTFAQLAGEELGLHVRVAQFTERKGQRIFRMIVDAELDRNQLTALMQSTVRDYQGVYKFSYLESIAAPIVDNTRHTSTTTHYLRVTFM